MFKFWSLFTRQSLPASARPAPEPAEGPLAAGSLDQQVMAIIRRECPVFAPTDMRTRFDRLGIDSVGMLMIHTAVEEATNKTFDSRQWEHIATPADLIDALRGTTAGRRRGVADTAIERRQCQLNMPQMALGGLSELWLFKELGDMHWSVLARAFGCPSHMLRDEAGERVYATFTRFRLDATCPVGEFGENERINLELRTSRHGAGMFFSDGEVSGTSGSISASLMSTFTKFGQSASNMSLLKGLPEIPPCFDVPLVADFPAFGQNYRTRRSQGLPPAIFECEYEIIPPHDINGVGLLYFAAYPIINDICAARHAGRSLMTDFSTVQRDVFYFGNSDPGEVLLYRLHEWHSDERSVDMAASIARKSDGNVIAHVQTRKARPTETSRSRSASLRPACVPASAGDQNWK